MPTQQSVDKVGQIKDQINDSVAVYLMEYHGLDANTFNALRKEIRAKGGQITVVKNTLFQIAMSQSEQGVRLPKKTLSDSSAALFASEDAVGPLKAIVDYAKENDDLPKLKIGFMDGKTLDEAQLKQLSDLPGIDQLRGQVVGMLNSPIQRLVGSLNGNLQKLVIALSEIQKQKEN